MVGIQVLRETEFQERTVTGSCTTSDINEIILKLNPGWIESLCIQDFQYTKVYTAPHKFFTQVSLYTKAFTG